MKQLRVPKKLFTFFLAVIAVVTIAGVFLQLLDEDRKAYQRVNRTYEVQTLLQTVLLNVEAVQDDYEDYHRDHSANAHSTFTVSFRKVFDNLDVLKQLLVANPKQTLRLQTLRRDITVYGAALETSTSKTTDVQEDALFEKVHRSADSMKQAEEENLEQSARNQSVAQRRVNVACICFLLVVSLLLVSLLLNVRRDEAEQIRRANDKQEILHQAAQRRNQELQALARRMVELQEAERGRLAHELHEEVGQVLVGLQLSLGGIGRLPEAAREAHIQMVRDLVATTIRQVRVLSLDLRPGVLDDFGLVPALEWYRRRYTEQTEVLVDLRMTGLNTRLDNTVETTAYRIVQEALANAAHHSEVKEIDVHLTLQEEHLTVHIAGRGSGLAGQDANCFCDHSVLIGMQERAALIGGTLEVALRQGQGRAIIARLPIHPVYTSLEA
jgi:signal transduction histidine kinase